MAGWGKRTIPDTQKEESDNKLDKYLTEYEQTGKVTPPPKPPKPSEANGLRGENDRKK